MKIRCLKGNSYVKSEKCMFPVIFILFCRFSLQYMCLWRYDIFFKSVYFLSVSWVEIGFWMVLGAKDTLNYFIDEHRFQGFDAWRTILMWNWKKTMFHVIFIFFGRFSMQYMCLWRNDIFFKSVYFLSVSWVEIRFWVVLGEKDTLS